MDGDFSGVVSPRDIMFNKYMSKIGSNHETNSQRTKADSKTKI